MVQDVKEEGRPFWFERRLPPADLYVVGLGAVGLRACIEARKLGASVVGVDAGRIGGGASGRNGGFLLAGPACFFHQHPDVDLYAATLEAIRASALELPGCVRLTGSERRAADEAEREDLVDHATALSRAGFRADLDRHRLFLADDASYDPLARTLAWSAQARAAGALLVEHVALDRAALDDLPARAAVLVCVDGGVERLLPELSNLLASARLQMLATAPVAARLARNPVYVRWGYDYWQQLPTGELLLGGLRDRYESAEWTTEASPTPEVQAGLDRLLSDVLGGHPAVVTHRWAGLSAYPLDGPLPFAGPVSPGARILVATGYSGTGNVLGPLVGSALVRLALTGDPPPAWLGRPPA